MVVLDSDVLTVPAAVQFVVGLPRMSAAISLFQRNDSLANAAERRGTGGQLCCIRSRDSQSPVRAAVTGHQGALIGRVLWPYELSFGFGSIIQQSLKISTPRAALAASGILRATRNSNPMCYIPPTIAEVRLGTLFAR